MLMSDGFKLFNRDATGVVDTSLLTAGMQKIAEDANKASVVIYTADPGACRR